MLLNPLDIAPHAPRHTRAAWIVLTIGVAVALLGTSSLALSGYAWVLSQQDVRQAQARFEVEATRRARAEADEPAGGAVARLAVQRHLRLSWDGLFATLEAAGQHVDGRATITSLAPVRLRGEAAEVNITGLATSSDMMLQYLRVLEQSQHVQQVRLASHQPALQEAVPVVKFTALLSWAPTARSSSSEATLEMTRERR